MALINEPIVLGSNITGNYGALPGDPNYYTQEDPTLREGMVENEDGTFTIPTYQRSQNEIASDFDWSMYGSKYAPMLRYFNSVKTGEFIYDPSEDQISEEEATALAGDFTTETGLDPKEVIKQELISYGGQIAAGIGGQLGRASAAAGGLPEGASNLYNSFKGLDVFRAPADGPGAKILNSPGTLRAEIADRGPQLTKVQKSALQAEKVNAQERFDDAFKKGNVEARQTAKKDLDRINEDLAPITGTGSTSIFSGVQDRSGFGTVTDAEGNKTMSAAGKANIGGSLGAGAVTIAYNLASGKNLRKSLEAGVKVGLGTYVGGLFGPLGSMIGGLVGGRVICNELMRQGIMTRKQVVLDYKFTRDHLTPTHVNGYHVWAVWMVKQMRKGRLVNFWTHVAGHRANEIAYIYGERDKPDYLGKVYRKVLEPICWSIGFFCQKTDWTVLYKEKEI